MAVDGTDVETWGALHGEAVTVDLDGEAAETQLVETAFADARQGTKRRAAKVLGIGPDGRKRYTADPDARAGHRSATNSRPAGPYVGYELHLAVQARDVRWTNHIDRTTLGPEVPGVITTCNLVPAGTHRGRSVVDDAHRGQGWRSRRSTTWCGTRATRCAKPGTTAYPLAQAGIDQTFQPVTHQRGIRPFSGEALLHRRSALSLPICPKSSVTWPLRLGARPAGTKRRLRERSSTSGPAGDSSVTPGRTSTASPGGAVPSAPGCSEAASSRRPCGALAELPLVRAARGVTRVLLGDPFGRRRLSSRSPSASPSAPPRGGSPWAGARSSSR